MYSTKIKTQLEEIFTNTDSASVYDTLLALGAKLPSCNPTYEIPLYQVKGCQSTVYLKTHLKDNKLVFEGSSDALITKGLLHLLFMLYAGSTCEEMLQASLEPLQELNLSEILSPSRANGFVAIFTKMQKQALELLLDSSSSS